MNRSRLHGGHGCVPETGTLLPDPGKLSSRCGGAEDRASNARAQP